MNGKEFKKIREGLELTQEELADVLCLSGKVAISNIETGFRNPSLLTVVVLKLLESLSAAKSKELQSQLLKLRKQSSESNRGLKRG